MEWITTFGQWVKSRRRALDLTQEQFAQQVGCSPAAIKKIESGERRPSRQIAALLARRLQLSPEQCDVFVRVARGELTLDRLPALKAELLAEPQEPRRASAGMAGAQARSSIPIPPAPFIGREHELAEITRLMQSPGCRLLTLTGIGGTGKTRLAIEAALRLREAFDGNVYFVSLAGTSAAVLIPAAIANALGMNFSGPVDPKIQLFHYLHHKKALLVLDNLEHLPDGADLIGELLQNAPELQLLATSREHLHLQAEWVFDVSGLPVPHSAQVQVIESSSACRLFLQTARQARASFQAGEEDYAAIGRICQMVQGLPLAIELAARWTRVLSCVDIAGEIERGLDFLAANSQGVSPRDISTRHRSLQAVFDHSWNLLAAPEQSVLQRLSVFRGGFTRQAAEQVAGANLLVLSALIDKSLLQHRAPDRYDLHELIRQYLAARLAENGAEHEAAYDRHSRHYLAWLQEMEPDLRSRRQQAALTGLAEDIDNIRLAWQTAVARGAFDSLGEAATPLYYLYELRQDFTEAIALFRQTADALRAHLAASAGRRTAREQAGLEITLAQLLNFQGYFHMRHGDNREALEPFEASLALLRAIQPASPAETGFPLAFGLIHTGIVYWAWSDFDRASRFFEEGLEISRSLEQTWLRGLVLGFIGAVWHERGDYLLAYEHLQEAMQVLIRADDPYLILFIGTYYSHTMMALHRLEEAHALLEGGLQGIRGTGNRWMMALGLESLAQGAQLSGNAAEAGSLLEESLRLHREVGDPWSLTVALLDRSRYNLWQADFPGAEQDVLEALHLTAETGSAHLALEGLAVLAQLCAKQGRPAEALALARFALAHPASKPATRAAADALRAAAAAELDAERLEEAQKINLDALMQARFAMHLPAMLL